MAYTRLTRTGLGYTIRITPKQLVLPDNFVDGSEAGAIIEWDDETRQLRITPVEEDKADFKIVSRGSQQIINASIVGKLLGITEGSRLFPYERDGLAVIVLV